MVAPPLDVGAVQDTVAWFGAGTAEGDRGGPGTVVAVGIMAAEDVDAAPVPAVLVAVAEKV
jgi:hypothetical protein